jgi:hypothetical protein
VTDLAHRNLRGCELAAMTVSACFVPGKPRRRVVVSAFVTRVAGEGTVALAVVQKLRIVALRSLRRSGDKNEQSYKHKFCHLMSLRLSGGLSAIR